MWQDIRDAVLYSVGANAEHGARRTNEDKRRCVDTLLRDPEWCKWSNREIAKRCKVSPKLVNNMRDELTEADPQLENKSPSSEATEEGQRSVKYITKHGTEAEMKTSNIGRTKGNIDEMKIPVKQLLYFQFPYLRRTEYSPIYNTQFEFRFTRSGNDNHIEQL